MVITQESAQSLAALNRPVAADVHTPREQQDVALPLMIPFGMVMLDIFAQHPTQGALTKEDYIRQALLLHRPDPALRIGILKGSQLHLVHMMGRSLSGSPMCSIHFTGMSSRCWTGAAPGERI